LRPVILALGEGSLADCDLVRAHFDYVFEDTLVGPPPACISLVTMNGKYRLWKVIAHESSGTTRDTDSRL
jgi:hypothetical protein